jgi:hypothetical protein
MKKEESKEPPSTETTERVAGECCIALKKGEEIDLGFPASTNKKNRERNLP